MATATHTQTNPSVFIKALSNYFRQMPVQQGQPTFRPQGVMLRTHAPNQPSERVAHPVVHYPGAPHIATALAHHVATHSKVSNGIQFKPGKPEVVHPGKALALKSVKAIHLSTPKVPKVGV